MVPIKMDIFSDVTKAGAITSTALGTACWGAGNSPNTARLAAIVGKLAQWHAAFRFYEKPAIRVPLQFLPPFFNVGKKFTIFCGPKIENGQIWLSNHQLETSGSMKALEVFLLPGGTLLAPLSPEPSRAWCPECTQRCPVGQLRLKDSLADGIRSALGGRVRQHKE